MYSHLLFNWLNPMIALATKVDFNQEMHYDLRREDRTANVADGLEREFRRIYPKGMLPVGTHTPVSGLFWSIWRTFKTQILLGTLGFFMISVAEMLTTFMVYKSIEAVSAVNYDRPLSESAESFWDIALWLSLFTIFKVGSSLLKNFTNFRMILVGFKIRNALNIMVFRKMMRKSMESDTTFDMGDITNLSQVDTQNFTNLGWQFGAVIQSPLQIIFGVISLYLLLGKAILPAMVIMVLILLSNYLLTLWYDMLKKNYSRVSDQRGKIVNEIFKNIRFIKMVGLETFYLAKLVKIRNEELSWLTK